MTKKENKISIITNPKNNIDMGINPPSINMGVINPPPPIPNFGIEEIMKLLNSQIDPSQKLLADLSGTLFDTKKLLMIARLDMNLAYYIIKHLIVINIYQEYYSGIVVKKIMVKNSEPPYYKFKNIRGDVKAPDLERARKSSYQRFINELLQITIAFDGKGRGEILEIIKELRERIKQDELAEKGIVGRAQRLI